jgi:DNA-binding SARP family transcriptional activator
MADHSMTGRPPDEPTTTVAPRVLILGPPTIDGATGQTPTVIKAGRSRGNHTARATELIAYLALHPDGVTTGQLAEVHAASPAEYLLRSTLHSLVSRMRRWLGHSPDGRAYLPRTGSGGVIALDRTVRTDWHTWLDLVGPKPAAASTEALEEALRLVRGRPLEGVPGDRWLWATPLQVEMTAAVIEACHELATRAMAAGDIDTARAVIARGNRVNSRSQRLWRTALQVELDAGDVDRQRALIAQLVRIEGRDGHGVEQATAELLAGLARKAQ